MNDYLKEDIYAKEILKNIQTDNLDLSILISKLQESRRNKHLAEIAAIQESNKDLVGRCFKRKTFPYANMFPGCWRYYKIISAISENPYRVECLVFDEYPTYWFNGRYEDGDKSGTYEFTSFYNKSVVANQLKNYTEISANEYWLAAKKYISYLSVMEWPSNHYRGGNVWPHELKWKTK